MIFYYKLSIFCTYLIVQAFSYFNSLKLPSSEWTHLTLNGNSKNTEKYLRIYRLKQMLSSEKNYSNFLVEQQRYASLNATLKERQDAMKAVIEYKNNSTNIYRAVFLPDRSINADISFYSPLLNGLKSQGIFLTMMPMLNVYEFNTKRYEVQWIRELRDELKNFEQQVVLGHGSSAEALLRYLETDKVKTAIIVDGTDLYTAGERHGREYHYSKMKSNSDAIYLASTKKEIEETVELQSKLKLTYSEVCLVDIETNSPEKEQNIQKLIKFIKDIIINSTVATKPKQHIIF